MPGSPGSRGGVPLFFTVLSKLLRMEPNEMLPGPQMSPVLRKRFATSGAHSHGCSAPQLHWYSATVRPVAAVAAAMASRAMV